MKNLPLLLGTILGTVVLIGIVAFLFSGPAQAPTQTTAIDPQVLLADATKVSGGVSPEAMEAMTDDTQVAELPEPAVTVVEFSDFQCPACKAAQPLVEQLKDAYPEMRFVYRHFPLDQIHANARLAAQASEVALQEGKFWEMHDMLFARQGDWEDIASKDTLIETFAGYAEELEIDKQAFIERIESTEVVEAVQADAALADEIGVQATPTFYVNGIQTPAPQLFATVESLMPQDEASAGAEEAEPQQ